MYCLQELHERYYEPYAEVQPSLDAILRGPPVKKLLFMTDADVISSRVIPHWQACCSALYCGHLGVSVLHILQPVAPAAQLIVERV